MLGLIKNILGVSAIIRLACNIIAPANGEFTCTRSGKFADENDPAKYHECTFVGEGKFTHAEHSCPPDNCFVSSSQACHFVGGECGGADHAIMTSKSLFPCEKAGKFAHPDKARKGSYIKCVETEAQLYAYEYQCMPTKPCFCEEKQKCVAECKK